MNINPLVAIFADAIQQRRIVSFIYKGEVRVVEPHALGLNGRLRAFQLYPEDDSRSGWRIFDLDRMEVAKFKGPRPGYVMGDKGMPEGIVAQLEA